MNSGRELSPKVPFDTHPIFTVVLSVLSIILGVWFAIASESLGSEFRLVVTDMQFNERTLATFSRLFNNPWLSFLIGLAIALPAMLVEKWLLKNHTKFYASFYLMPLSKRLRWDIQKTNLCCWLPIILAPMVAVGLTWFLNISVYQALLGSFALTFLTYPEKREIYRFAKIKFVAGDGG